MIGKNKIIEIALIAIFAFGIFALSTQPARAQTADRAALLAQIEAVKRQILILQIQLIEMRIYDLQIQLGQLSPAVFIDVLWPAGDEKLENWRGYYILWEAQGVEKVSVELKTQESARVIAQNIPAAEGRWYWNTGSIAGDSYRIRVFDAANPQISGETVKTFLVFDNSLKNKCVDGTIAGQCSAEKPNLCFDVEIGLVPACKSCGCPAGKYCGADSRCR